MFDSKRAFGIRLVAAAKDSAPLLYSILAIGARQLERKEKTQSSFDSLELYQEAIRLLTPLLSARDTQVIAACVILCCLEMFSASAQDWRHHLEGCAAVFEAFGVNGFSGDVLQAVFWCYVRMGKFWNLSARCKLLIHDRCLWRIDFGRYREYLTQTKPVATNGCGRGRCGSPFPKLEFA